MTHTRTVDRTAAALQAFDDFAHAYLGPAALEHAFAHGNRHEDRVRKAILAISAYTPPSIGYAVFNEHLDEYRERRQGFAHTIVSTVFDDPPDSALAYCLAKWPRQHFLVGAIQQHEIRA